ncbi:MAG TPA: hypothetical protein VGE64_03185 [Xanthomonadaceae bacterium]
MATITDFEAWLEQADPEGHEEVYALYQAVYGAEDYGFYECKVSADGTKWFIKSGHVEDTLMLASEKARSAFLSLIENKYTEGDMDIESWYGYRRAMAKDD